MPDIPDKTQRTAVVKALLHRVSVFEQLDDAELHWVIDRLQERPFRTGEVLVRQGEPGFAFFLIVRGKVGVYREWWKFRRRVATRGPDECFGEMALLDDAPRYFTVQADDDGEVLVLTREAFQEVLLHNPEAKRVLHEMADYRGRRA